MDEITRETIRGRLAHADAQLNMAKARLGGERSMGTLIDATEHHTSAIRALSDAVRLWAEAQR